MKNIFSFLIALAVAMTLFSYSSAANSTPEQDVIKYQCPMKCEGEKTYDKPGKCAVCGMELEKIEINSHSKTGSNKVNISGAMMNVMHKGELAGTISLDTIQNKQHLYGLGPVEYLKGEILITDGKSYVSTVAKDGSIAVDETYHVKAPFFVYEYVDNWKEISLPDSIQTIQQLESFLDQTTTNHTRPFAFRVTANIAQCEIHIVDLPAGITVHSPADAHQNQKSFILKNESAEMTGFFSTTHQGIFTHHDSYVHMHLITADKKKMGHLENLLMIKGTAKLYLPLE